MPSSIKNNMLYNICIQSVFIIGAVTATVVACITVGNYWNHQHFHLLYSGQMLTYSIRPVNEQYMSASYNDEFRLMDRFLGGSGKTLTLHNASVTPSTNAFGFTQLMAWKMRMGCYGSETMMHAVAPKLLQKNPGVYTWQDRASDLDRLQHIAQTDTASSVCRCVDEMTMNMYSDQEIDIESSKKLKNYRLMFANNQWAASPLELWTFPDDKYSASAPHFTDDAMRRSINDFCRSFAVPVYAKEYAGSINVGHILILGFAFVSIGLVFEGWLQKDDLNLKAKLLQSQEQTYFSLWNLVVMFLAILYFTIVFIVSWALRSADMSTSHSNSLIMYEETSTVFGASDTPSYSVMTMVMVNAIALFSTAVLYIIVNIIGNLSLDKSLDKFAARAEQGDTLIGFSDFVCKKVLRTLLRDLLLWQGWSCLAFYAMSSMNIKNVATYQTVYFILLTVHVMNALQDIYKYIYEICQYMNKGRELEIIGQPVPEDKNSKHSLEIGLTTLFDRQVGLNRLMNIVLVIVFVLIVIGMVTESTLLTLVPKSGLMTIIIATLLFTLVLPELVTAFLPHSFMKQYSSNVLSVRQYLIMIVLFAFSLNIFLTSSNLAHGLERSPAFRHTNAEYAGTVAASAQTLLGATT